MAFQVPLFPLSTVLLPGMPMPLRLFEPRYLRMFEDREHENPAFGLVLLRSSAQQNDQPDIHQVGTLAKFHRAVKRPPGLIDVEVIGTHRFLIEDVDWSGLYAVATVTEHPSAVTDTANADAKVEQLTQLFYRYVQGIARLVNRQFTGISADRDVDIASYDFASRLPLHTWEIQRLLEESDVNARLAEVERLIHRELALLRRYGLAGLALNHAGNDITFN